MRDALDVMATKPHAKTAVIEAWSALGDITERALEDETAGEHAFAMFSLSSPRARQRPRPRPPCARSPRLSSRAPFTTRRRVRSITSPRSWTRWVWTRSTARNE